MSNLKVTPASSLSLNCASVIPTSPSLLAHPILIHHFLVQTCYVYIQCGPWHRPLCTSHSNSGVHHWLDRLWIFKFLNEITWLTSVQWKTSLHLTRALPYQLIMARSGDRSFDKMAFTCRSHGRATEETQKLREGGVDSSRSRNMFSAGWDKNLYLILISLWMVPYIPETVPSLLFDPFVKNYYSVSL